MSQVSFHIRSLQAECRLKLSTEGKTTKYELWLSTEECYEYSFFPLENNASARKLLITQAKLIWTVEAQSWDEGCQGRNNFLGWGPYITWSEQFKSK